MDSAFIHQAANELVQNAGTRNIKQIARSCSLDISETSRIKDMLGLLSLYFDKPLMLIEKINAIFPLCHSIFFELFPIFSPNVHSTIAENGIIIITFSMHCVVSFCSPFTVSKIPHPPMTLDKGFIHRFRFSSVLNKIIEVTNSNRNSFRKNTLSLNF